MTTTMNDTTTTTRKQKTADKALATSRKTIKALGLDLASAKPAKPAKAPKAPKADKPVKVKAAKATPAPAAEWDPAAEVVEQLLGDFHSSDTRDDRFMRELFRKAFDAGKQAKRARAPRAGGPTKRELAAALLQRPEGATTREILDLTDWPAISVPALAKASKLKLTMKKDGRSTTYFGTPI